MARARLATRWLLLGLLALGVACGGSGSGPEETEPAEPMGLVTDFFSGEVMVVDFAAGQTTLTTPVGSMPMDVEVLPSGGTSGTAYVPTLDDMLVEVELDRSTDPPTGTPTMTVDLTAIPVPLVTTLTCAASSQDPALFQPAAVAVDEARDRAYVPSIIATTVVDLATGQVIDQLMDLDGQVLRGAGASDACVTATGDLYICNFATANVSWHSQGAFQTPIPVGDLPVGIACDDAYVYVACLLDDEIHVIDQSAGQVVTTVPAGAAPMGVALDPGHDLCYVANFLSGDITVIDTTTLMPTSYSPVAATPDTTLAAALGVDSATLQTLFNQLHAGLLPTSDPLCNLGALFGALGPGGSGGLQGLTTNLLQAFVDAQGPFSGGSIPFAGLQAVAGRAPRIYATSAFAGTISVIEDAPAGVPPTLLPLGGGIANFGPNAIDLW